MKQKTEWVHRNNREDEDRWEYDSGEVLYQHWADLKWVNFVDKYVDPMSAGLEGGFILGDQDETKD